MTRTRVKICGLKNEVDRDAAIEAGADAVGFITHVPVDSPREISVERAAELADGVPPFVTSVLVTMPESVDEAVNLHETVDADAVQIHGSLSPAQLEQFTSEVEVPVVAAVDVGNPELRAYAGSADALLVDSTSEDGGGGTGTTHDWGRTRELATAIDVPLVLAGGLTPDNVASAVDAVGPFAVDTASGVGREGGRKDHDAVAAFVDNARRSKTEKAPKQGNRA